MLVLAIRSSIVPLVAAAATLLVSPAAASASSDCTDFDVEVTQPPDDRVVPRASILRAFVDRLECTGQPQLRVVCEGATVASSLRTTQPLEAPLPADAPPEGTRCSLEVWSVDDEVEVLSVDFTIGSDETPPPPTPARLTEAELRRHVSRDGAPGPHRGSVTVEVDPDPLGMTVVRVVEPDTGEVRGAAAAPRDGGVVVLDELWLMDRRGDEACFVVETVDAVGATARLDTCAPSTATDTDDEGGCAVAGSSPTGAATTAALVLAALAASRRRAATSRPGAARPSRGRR